MKNRIKTICFSFFILPYIASVAVSKVNQEIEAGESGVVIENQISVEASNGAKAKASVQSQVNGQSVAVEIGQPGKISVSTKNGQTTIESTPDLTPTIFINHELNKNQEIQKSLSTPLISLKQKIVHFFKIFFQIPKLIFAK